MSPVWANVECAVCLGYSAVLITLMYLKYCQALYNGPNNNQYNDWWIMQIFPAFIVLVGDCGIIIIIMIWKAFLSSFSTNKYAEQVCWLNCYIKVLYLEVIDIKLWKISGIVRSNWFPY